MNRWVILGLVLAALLALYLVFLRAPDPRDRDSQSLQNAGSYKPAPSTDGRAAIRIVDADAIVAKLDPAKRSEIQSALDDGRKIDAIVMLREAASIDLKDAKTVAEHMQRTN